MQWKPRIDYLLNLDRPLGGRRSWSYALLEIAGRPYGKPIPYTTLATVMWRARGLYLREVGDGADRSGEPVLLLVEDLRPLPSRPPSTIVALHCPERGCGRFLVDVDRSRPMDPVLPVRQNKRWIERLVSLPPTRLPPEEWPDLFERIKELAQYFTVHTECRRCGTRAAWDLSAKTSWARYRRSA